MDSPDSHTDDETDGILSSPPTFGTRTNEPIIVPKNTNNFIKTRQRSGSGAGILYDIVLTPIGSAKTTPRPAKQPIPPPKKHEYSLNILFGLKRPENQQFEERDVESQKESSVEEEIDPAKEIPKEESSDDLVEADNLTDELSLVFFKNKKARYMFSMPFGQPSIFVSVSTNYVKNLLTNANVMAVKTNELTDVAYSNLYNFCRINNNIPYNILMEVFVGSSFLKGAVSFINGFCCYNQPQPEPIIAAQNKFTIPPHALVGSLGPFFSVLLDYPREDVSEMPVQLPHIMVTSHKEDDSDDDVVKEDDEDDHQKQTTGLDLYSTHIVSKFKFTNSYQLHIFTYIGYIGGFISRGDFIDHAAIGFPTTYAFLQKVYQNTI